MVVRFLSAAILLASACIASSPVEAQLVTKEPLPGVTNYAHVETTVACAGAITVDAVPKIKEIGFASIINLRESGEAGANVEAEEAAAKQSGIRYYHIPFNAQSPDPQAVEQFLTVITTPGTEPAFIHCASGNRAAAMWLIKRIVIDQWNVDRALNEAADLGLGNPKLMQWALQYADSHKKEAHIPGAAQQP